MESKFLRLLYSFDIFGIQLEFRKNDRNTFNTTIGSIFSILIYISLIILSFIFGKEIYERKIPRVSSGFEILQANDTDVDVSKVYPFTFVLRNGRTAELLKYDEYYNIDMKIWDNTNKTTGNQIKILNAKDVISQCTIEQFDKVYHEAFENVNLNTFICFNFNNMSVRNDRSTPNSLFITLEIKLCDENIRKCPADFKSKTQSVFSNSFYLDAYLNPKNKDQIIKQSFSKNPQLLNIDTQKHTYYRITKNILSIDYGWIVEDVKLINYLTTDLLQESLVKINKSDPTIQVIYLESQTKVLNTNIKYMKVQDLLANIGGLLNGLFVIGKIIITNYTHFSFYFSTYYFIIDSYHQNIFSEEEKFYSDLLLENKKISKVDSIKKFELKSVEHDVSKFDLNNGNKNSINKEIYCNIKIEKPSILNLQDNIKKNNENDTMKNKNYINSSDYDTIKFKFKDDVKDQNLNQKDLINHNSLNSQNILLNSNELMNEDLVNVVEKMMNTKMEKFIQNSELNKLLEINQKISNYFKVIENNNEYEQEENFLLYIIYSFFCCKSLNKKQINLSNYLLSYERFLKHSMMNMASSK